jgi:hypothetical protein
MDLGAGKRVRLTLSLQMTGLIWRDGQGKRQRPAELQGYSRCPSVAEQLHP